MLASNLVSRFFRSDQVDAAVQRLAEARAHEDIARARHADALLDSPDDTAATSAALEAAQRATADAALALDAARARHDAARAARSDDEGAARRKRATDIAKRRLSAAREAEAAADTLAAKLAEINELGSELFENAPAREGGQLFESGAHHSHTERVIRSHLRHRGLLWAASVPWDSTGRNWGAADALTFSNIIDTAQRVILRETEA